MDNKAIRKYLLRLVNELDGYGLVVTDDDLIKERLKDFSFGELKTACEDGNS